MRPNLGRTVIGGIAGTAVMTAMMYMVAPMMGVKMDIAGMLGSMIGGWTRGMILHVLNGSIVFPLVYALLLYRLLRGASALRGALFGGLLWLIAQLVVMPIMGAGFFSAHAGGMLAAGASFLGHIAYGVLLGVIAGRAAAPNQAYDDRPIYLSRYLRESRTR
jgi:hypothetical protein